MGEEKQEEAKVETKVEEKKEEKTAEEKKEEKPAEEKKEEKPAEEKKEETAPSPPPPIILSVQLHCVGCAKKIERSIWKCKGVEEVEVDMGQNKVTVKGAVDPQALCTRIQKKTMRSAKVLSPLPPADGEATTPEAPPPQVTGVSTVELLVNMHCEACAQQLRKKILKMKGVQAVETELTTRKVTVTGTMDAEQLVKYIYRKTRKLAKVIPPPPPPPPKEEEKKEEAEKKPEEKPAEEKKEEKVEEKKEEEKAPQDGDKVAGEEQKKEDEKAPQDGDKVAGEEQKKEDEGEVAAVTEEDMAKKLAYIYGGGMINYRPMHSGSVMNYGPMYGGGMMNYGGGMMNYGYGAGMVNEEEMARRMVPWRPLYIAEQPLLPPPPPTQMFSDENPNACSIS